jgi:hypothetical protein
MIDIENKVINDVFSAVRSAYSGASCYGEYVATPASFPCVTLYEADNRTYKRSQDTDLQEHQAHLMYECNVYSDKATGKKAEARAIANLVDTTMQNMKFTRTFYQPLPNLDRTIFRITMRWEAIAGEPVITTTTGTGNETVTTTTYQMYRE